MAEGIRGDRLLSTGDVAGARAVYEAMLARLGPEPTYARAVALGQSARCLRVSGDPRSAMARLDEALAATAALPSSTGVISLRASLLSERGQLLRRVDKPIEARTAHMSALALIETLDDPRAQMVELAHIAAIACAMRRWNEARERSTRAMALAARVGDPALEALVLGQLGTACGELGDVGGAIRHHAEAARILEASGDRRGAARTQGLLATFAAREGDLPEAERWHRAAIGNHAAVGDAQALWRELAGLGALVRRTPERLDEAERLIEDAISVGHMAGRDAAVWRLHGLLADIAETCLARATDPAARERFEAAARTHREVERQAPRIVEALAKLGDRPCFARAAILGSLGRSFAAAGRWELAARELQQAASMLDASDDGSADDGALRSLLEAQLAQALEQLDRDEAGQHFQAAVQRCRSNGDTGGEALNLCRLGAWEAARGQPSANGRFEAALRIASAVGDRSVAQLAREALDRAGRESSASSGASVDVEEMAGSSGLRVVAIECVFTEYVFEPDLLLDGPQQCHMAEVQGAAAALPLTTVPAQALGSRIDVDDDGAIRLRADDTEPGLVRLEGCVVLQRSLGEVRASGAVGGLWRLLRTIDGHRTVAAILDALPEAERAAAAGLLDVLARARFLDVSGRSHGRHLHALTKKGVLPGGSLASDEVMMLATDGNYRRYVERPTVPLGTAVPERLGAFHALTRARRSRRDFNAGALGRDAFDALLSTACGITGELSWSGRGVALRAYPSSGALYAVEIYPVVLRVEGLSPAVYHLRAADNLLELVRADLDVERFVAAMLPVERAMVAASAVMVCLVGHFPRHEQKYGEGGYRMLVAEAGHVSQNLLMTATALGLAARPFGGVFDDLVNEDLQLDPQREQFLLSVLVGRTDELDRKTAAGSAV